MLSEVSETQKEPYSMTSSICGIHILAESIMVVPRGFGERVENGKMLKGQSCSYGG